MANELTTTIGLVYTKTPAPKQLTLTKTSDIATGRATEASQVIGTSEEQFALVDVSTVRYIAVQNTDATNFVQVGTATGAYSIKLLPGDIALFPPNANALFLKSDTAACVVNILAVSA
jgi:hypothetical protein